MSNKNNLKLNLELSESDSDSSSNKKNEKKLLESKNEKLNKNDDYEEDFSNELSGRKNKSMDIDNDKNKKKERKSSTSSSSSTETLSKSRSKSSLKKNENESSRSSSRSKSRSSSRPDSRKKKVSFNESSRSCSSCSDCSSCTSCLSDNGSSTTRSEKLNKNKLNDEKTVISVENNEKLNKPKPSVNLSLSSSDEENKKKIKKASSTEKQRKSRDTNKKSSKIKKQSNSSSSSSLSSSDDENAKKKSSIQQPKVYVDQKPPIDKANLKTRCRSPSLEKPSENEIVNNAKGSNHKINNKKKQLITSSTNDNDSSGGEMTDVSPLPSPYQPKVTITPKSKSKSSTTTTTTTDQIKVMNFNEVFDMRELMKTIDDKIEKYTQQSSHRTTTRNSPNHLNHSNENLASAKLDTKHSSGGYNYNTLKFLSNSQLLESDSEFFNTRRGEVVKKAKKIIKEKNLFEKPIRVTSSALNRMKEQQRIEKENRQILKRLLDVKPSKDLSREKQLKDYYKHYTSSGVYYYTNENDNDISTAAAAAAPLLDSTLKLHDYSSARYISSAASLLANQYTGSASSFTRPDSAKSGQHSRLSSAKSTKGRSSRSNVHSKQNSSRPAWDDRW